MSEMDALGTPSTELQAAPCLWSHPTRICEPLVFLTLELQLRVTHTHVVKQCYHKNGTTEQMAYTDEP